MLQETVTRLHGIANLGKPVLVCNNEHRFLIAEQLLEIGVEKIRSKERDLTAHFLEKCENISGIRVHGPRNADLSVAVVSLDAPREDSGYIAARLFEEYGIITRSGLHCSPCAHQAAGTFPYGSVRFSFGYETTYDEIDAAVEALRAVLKP
jgi:selenocysteine lyase/cysteine desulfurase